MEKERELLEHFHISNKYSSVVAHRLHTRSPEQPPCCCGAMIDAGAHDGAAPSLHSFDAAVLNLAKAIVGAGMVAIPRAYLTLGAVPGTILLLVVALLVLYTKCVMVAGNERHPGACTYRALAQASCGRGVARLTQASVIAFCFGFCVVDLVVVADVIRGSPPEACNGLLCLLTGISSGPLVSRNLVLLVVAWGATAPLLLLRSMQRLTVLNYAGVGAALVLALVAAALGVAAVARGVSKALPLVPPPSATPGGKMRAAADLSSVLAVVLTSFVGHQNVHPLFPLLRPYSASRMRLVCCAALGVALAVYQVLAVGACLAFGGDLQANVLTNFNVRAMAPLLGSTTAAAAAAVAVQGGYAVTVTASFVLFVHPLRTSLAELIWDWRGDAAPGDGCVALAEAQHYLSLTYGLLAATTVAAICVPDIWQALAFVGNSAASLEGFVVPGLIAMSMMAADTRLIWRQRGTKGAGGGAIPEDMQQPLLAEQGVRAAQEEGVAAAMVAGTVRRRGLLGDAEAPVADEDTGSQAELRVGSRGRCLTASMWGMGGSWWACWVGNGMLATLVALLGVCLLANGVWQQLRAAHLVWI